jgi:hypothetical protein
LIVCGRRQQVVCSRRDRGLGRGGLGRGGEGVRFHDGGRRRGWPPDRRLRDEGDRRRNRGGGCYLRRRRGRSGRRRSFGYGREGKRRTRLRRRKHRDRRRNSSGRRRDGRLRRQGRGAFGRSGCVWRRLRRRLLDGNDDGVCRFGGRLARRLRNRQRTGCLSRRGGRGFRDRLRGLNRRHDLGSEMRDSPQTA